MIIDQLKDIVKHSHSLGFIDAVKITNQSDSTKLEAIADDRSVVMYGRLNSPFEGLNDGDIIGFSRMGILDGMLKFEHFNKVNIGSMTVNNEVVPCEIKFSSDSGHNGNYRFMAKAAAEQSIEVPSFRGVTWNVIIEPTKENLKDVSYFAGILGSYDDVFNVVMNGKKLEFHLGSNTADKTIVPIATVDNGTLSRAIPFPITKVLSILKLSNTSKCRMFFSEQGALKIEIDSGVGVYEFIIPAKQR